MKKCKKVLLILLCVAVAIPISLWCIEIAKCEYWTYKYGEQFEYSYREYTMIQSPDYHKILEYNDTEIVVYYVARGRDGGGDTLRFTRSGKDAEWTFVRWDTIWSNSGSASEFVWPYIR